MDTQSKFDQGREGREREGRKEKDRWGEQARGTKEGNGPISSPIPPGKEGLMSFSGGSIVVKRESLK